MTTDPTALLPFIAYQGSDLCVEQVPLQKLASRFGTPLFVYSKAAMLTALDSYRRGLSGRNAKIFYAMKANSSLALLQVFAEADCGFDIVSIGELHRVLAAGAPASRVIFSGVGKSRAEMAEALEHGVACFNLESAAELEVLNEVAVSCRRIAPISIRVNPNIDPKTHPYISTGLKGNKFGIAHEAVVDTYLRAASLPGVEVLGIDCHIGSQITMAEPYLEAMDRVLDLVEAVEAAGVHLRHIDFGGGLGIRYSTEQPPQADSLWRQLLAKIDARGFSERELMIEPGRSLVGNAGVCLTEVLYTKLSENKNFCIVDAAMNDLPRPALYQAFHEIVPIQTHNGPEPRTYDVVGPVCESGDWIGRDRLLSVSAGDHLAVLSAGAYCMSMASNYNTRGRAAEVLVDGENFNLIRERESAIDQMRNERLIKPV